MMKNRVLHATRCASRTALRLALCAAVTAAALAACSSNPRVTRVNAATQTDLSGYWNDTDLKLVSEGLIADCFAHPWAAQFQAEKKRPPVIIVGNFKNYTLEHLDTGILSHRLETAISRSGKAEFVASGDLRNEIRAERQDQLSGNTGDETVAALGRELGADFMLTGTIRTIVDRAGKTSVSTYIVTAELTSIETNRKLWIGENSEIKKIIVTPAVKF
jgi:uncharacterized protein (TIGR02722 family)